MGAGVRVIVHVMMIIQGLGFAPLLVAIILSISPEPCQISTLRGLCCETIRDAM